MKTGGSPPSQTKSVTRDEVSSRDTPTGFACTKEDKLYRSTQSLKGYDVKPKALTRASALNEGLFVRIDRTLQSWCLVQGSSSPKGSPTQPLGSHPTSNCPFFLFTNTAFRILKVYFIFILSV